MANGKKNCPECKHPNVMPAAGTKKITCGGCGMIIVLAKVYGDDWASATAPAPAGRPKIVTRRDRAKDPEPAAAAPSAPTGRRSKTRGRSQTDAGDGHSHGRRRPSKGGMPPALLWGSIGAIVVAGLLVGVVVKMNNDKKAEVARIEAKAEAEKKAAKQNTSAPGPEIDIGIPDIDSTVTNTSTAGDEPARTIGEPTKKVERKPRGPAHVYDSFPVDGISSEAKTAIDGAIAILKDLDATTEIRGAGRVLFQHRKDAIPVLINELFTIDLNDESDVRRGWSLIQELKTCAEHATGYENTFQIIDWPTEPADQEVGVKRRRTAIQTWHKWWSDNHEGWEPPAEEEW